VNRHSWVTALVGVAHEYRGQTVKAFVSLQPGLTATPEDLTAFCKERPAAYKYPRDIHILDELSRNAAGKTLRRELR
jgi:long-chain acyl-CoA synthetase